MNKENFCKILYEIFRPCILETIIYRGKNLKIVHKIVHKLVYRYKSSKVISCLYRNTFTLLR